MGAPRYDIELLSHKLNTWRQGIAWGAKNEFDWKEIQDKLGHISKCYFYELRRIGIFVNFKKGLYAFNNPNEPIHKDKIRNAFKKHIEASSRANKQTKINKAAKEEPKKSKKIEKVTAVVVREHKRFDFSVEDALALLKSKGYKITIEL